MHAVQCIANPCPPLPPSCLFALLLELIKQAPLLGADIGQPTASHSSEMGWVSAYHTHACKGRLHA